MKNKGYAIFFFFFFGGGGGERGESKVDNGRWVNGEKFRCLKLTSNTDIFICVGTPP